MSESNLMKPRDQSSLSRVFSANYEHIMYWVFNSLEQETATNFGIFVSLFMTAVVFFNIVLMIIKTENNWSSIPAVAILLFIGECVCTVILLLELYLRIWSSYAALSYKHLKPSFRRIRFFFTFWVLFDHIMIITQFYYISFTVLEWTTGTTSTVPYQVVVMFRIFRFLRLLRAQKASNGVEIMKNVLVGKWRELLVSFVLLLCVMLFLSSIMFFIEKDGQPNDFGSIPRSLYFTLITLSTVGYGDVTPKTWLGRFSVCIFVVWQLFLFSIPVTIIAAGIVEEMEKANRKNEETLAEQKQVLRNKLAHFRDRIQQRGNNAFNLVSTGENPEFYRPPRYIPGVVSPRNIGSVGSDNGLRKIDMTEYDAEMKRVEEMMKHIDNDEYLDTLVKDELLDLKAPFQLERGSLMLERRLSGKSNRVSKELPRKPSVIGSPRTSIEKPKGNFRLSPVNVEMNEIPCVEDPVFPPPLSTGVHAEVYQPREEPPKSIVKNEIEEPSTTILVPVTENVVGEEDMTKPKTETPKDTVPVDTTHEPVKEDVSSDANPISSVLKANLGKIATKMRENSLDRSHTDRITQILSLMEEFEDKYAQLTTKDSNTHPDSGDHKDEILEI